MTAMDGGNAENAGCIFSALTLRPSYSSLLRVLRPRHTVLPVHNKNAPIITNQGINFLLKFNSAAYRFI